MSHFPKSAMSFADEVVFSLINAYVHCWLAQSSMFARSTLLTVFRVQTITLMCSVNLNCTVEAIIKYKYDCVTKDLGKVCCIDRNCSRGVRLEVTHFTSLVRGKTYVVVKVIHSWPPETGHRNFWPFPICVASKEKRRPPIRAEFDESPWVIIPSCTTSSPIMSLLTTAHGRPLGMLFLFYF